MALAAASSASILSFSNFSASSAASFFSFSILAASSAASFFSFSILAASSIASFFSFSILAASSADSLGRVAGAPIGSGLSSPTASALTISSLGFSSLESLVSATATAVAIATGATTATGRDSSITISSPANFAKRSQISFGMNGGPFLAEQTLNTISESGDSNFLPTNPSNNNFIFVSSPPIICPPIVNITPVSSNKETGSFLPDTIFIVPVLICNPLSLFSPDPITLPFVAAILNTLAILPYVI